MTFTTPSKRSSEPFKWFSEPFPIQLPVAGQFPQPDAPCAARRPYAREHKIMTAGKTGPAPNRCAQISQSDSL